MKLIINNILFIHYYPKMTTTLEEKIIYLYNFFYELTPEQDAELKEKIYNLSENEKIDILKILLDYYEKAWYVLNNAKAKIVVMNNQYEEKIEKENVDDILLGL